MKLTVGEAATMLGTTDQRIYDWIEDESLPAQKIRGEYRINRAELLEWATERDLTFAPRGFQRLASENDVPSLSRALRSGGIHRSAGGSGLHEILGGVIRELPLAGDEDRDALLQVLVARETLGTTPVGEGIAIPHVRHPIVLAPGEAIAALVLLDHPLALRGPDGVAVDTLFFLVSPTVHAHLATLARLAYLLRKPELKQLLRRRAPDSEILAAMERLEASA
ncbi:MAG: PTS sugar transporter subunit IIA [Thermoanaerobaculia bacterium]